MDEKNKSKELTVVRDVTLHEPLPPVDVDKLRKSLNKGVVPRQELRILAAAIYVDGHIYSIPPPARHHTIIHWMVGDLKIGPQTGEWEEGFVITGGKFVRRKPAWIIAEAAGQIIRQSGPHGTLYSEDVW